MSVSTSITPTESRASELREALSEVRSQILESTPPNRTAQPPTLVAVSKYKPASDILACYQAGQRDFGENYVQELEKKTKEPELQGDIRWHFIGQIQSKAKNLATIPNLYCVQTVSSEREAKDLQKHFSKKFATSPSDSDASTSKPRLNVLIQVNTSGEDVKHGLPALSDYSDATTSPLLALARYIVEQCDALHLQGLMTIGSLSESLSSSSADNVNRDFERLRESRDVLEGRLKDEGEWGVEGRLVLSMGMSSDFRAAIKAGSDVVRVGTGIFGARAKKGEVPPLTS